MHIVLWVKENTFIELCTKKYATYEDLLMQQMDSSKKMFKQQ
jgi:hypothetical protein